MSSTTFPKTFREHLAAALWRRLNAGAITRKQLADAIGVTAHTVINWRNAFCDPGSYEIHKLYEFFGKSFWAEVFGDPQ